MQSHGGAVHFPAIDSAQPHSSFDAAKGDI